MHSQPHSVFFVRFQLCLEYGQKAVKLGQLVSESGNQTLSHQAELSFGGFLFAKGIDAIVQPSQLGKAQCQLHISRRVAVSVLRVDNKTGKQFVVIAPGRCRCSGFDTLSLDYHALYPLNKE